MEKLRYKKAGDDVTSRVLGISGQVQPYSEIYLLSSFLKNDDGKRLNFFGLEEGKEFDGLCQNVLVLTDFVFLKILVFSRIL
jgi:hypothetical protein